MMMAPRLVQRLALGGRAEHPEVLGQVGRADRQRVDAGEAAISSSRVNARFVSSMIVTCTREFAAAVCGDRKRSELGVRAEAVHPPLTERSVAAARRDLGRLF